VQHWQQFMAQIAESSARYEVLSGYDSPIGPLVIVERFPKPGLLQQCCHRLGVLTKITAVAVLLSYVAPVGSELPSPYDKLSSLVSDNSAAAAAAAARLAVQHPSVA
jgi:hypothetical protein